MTLKNLYAEYLELDPNKLSNSFFERVPRSERKFKPEIHDMIIDAITHQDKNQLRFALNAAYRDGVDNSYTSLIAQLLTATWHDEHEDLVDTIYLNNLHDESFADSLYKIAIEPGAYRKYDDESESTLRKCIHALKMINSEDADTYIEKLKNTKNTNVDFVLSMYGR